jgi:NNP family nitrate/nitrite transporter-like MFS transporter
LSPFLGAGNGAVFKLVPVEFPDNTGAATGIVGAAGGLGDFFPPLLMGVLKDAFDSYALGFVGLLVFCAFCLGAVSGALREQAGGRGPAHRALDRA